MAEAAPPSQGTNNEAVQAQAVAPIPKEWSEGRATPFAVRMNRFMIASLLILGTGVGYHIYKGHRDPDPRDPVTMTRDFMKARATLETNEKTRAAMQSDETIQAIAKNAMCVLNKMGHPLGDKYEGPDKIEHKRDTLDSYTYDPRPGKVQPKKYIFQPNTRDYVYEERIKDHIATIKAQKESDDTKDTMTWFTWTPEEFLALPLACVQDPETHSCAMTREGTPCKMIVPLAQVFSEADAAFYAEKKEKMDFIVCFRNDLHQAIAFVGIGGRGCKLEGEHDGLRAVGNSSHGMALAADVANSGHAQEYLAKYGVACGFIPGDEGHCSFGEKGMQGFLNNWMRKFNKAKDIWNLIHK